MSKTITRLFDSHLEALNVVDDLETAGVDQDQISIVSNNADNWHEGHRHAGGASRTGGPLGDRNGDGENDVADGAGKGATAGGLIGGGAGLLAGLGMLAIPGLGPVVAAGWLVSTAVGAAIGAAAGGTAGGLLGALKEAGHSDEDANIYAEGVRRGGTLVSVRADEDEVGRIEEILERRTFVDTARRGETYRQAGWSRFDQAAAPYSADDVTRERQAYLKEDRSFITAEPGGARTLDEPLSGERSLDRPDAPRTY